MIFWYKLSERRQRKAELLAGVVPTSTIHLYEETKAIVNDFYNNDFSNWYPLCKGYSTEPTEFESRKEAEKAYYTDEAEEIYCIMHDC